jgi:hypothetical protein
VLWGPALLAATAALLSAPVPLQAADPVVENVQFSQRRDGSQLVNVVYDVADADGDTLTVTLLASDDGGASWIFPVRTVSGDVGPGVLPGTGKTIVWDIGEDASGWEITNLRVRVAVSDAGIDLAPHSPANYAIMEWELVDWSLPGQFEKYARADLLVVQAGQMWGHATNESLEVYNNIKALNPGGVMLGYTQAKSVRLSWAGPGTFPYHQAFYERTLPYWCWSTEGDTVQDFPGNVVVNILLPECREAIIHTMAEFRQASVNRLDGIFWDYFGTRLWIHPGVHLEGEPDLDGDGIGHFDDPDEQAAYRAAQDSMIAAARDSLGEDFILLVNGSRARVDSLFASKVDGIFYELFPTLHPFESPNMAMALDPDFPYSLYHTVQWPSTSNGGPYVVLDHFGAAWYYDQNGEWTSLILGNIHRVAGLLSDTYATWNPPNVHTYAWTDNDISLGRPLGPAVINGDIYTREFYYGRLEMHMENGNHPNPFSYRIWVNGTLVEELDIPYHFP